MFVCVSVHVCEHRYVKHFKHVVLLLKSREPNIHVPWWTEWFHIWKITVRPNLISPGYSLKFRCQGRRLFHFIKKILIMFILRKQPTPHIFIVVNLLKYFQHCWKTQQYSLINKMLVFMVIIPVRLLIMLPEHRVKEQEL